MDAQDIVLWGEVVDTPERRLDERRRANELCQLWGKGGGEGGVDGFVRMELDFEVLLCDFTDGLELVTALNLEYSDFPDWPSSQNPLPTHSVARYPDNALNGDGDLGPPPFIYWLPGIRGLLSGLRHAHFPGEMRIQLHYHRLITFYDTTLFPSLRAVRQGKGRWEHRLKGIVKEDVERLHTRLTTVIGMKGAVREESWESSGVDWRTTLRVLQVRWEDGLEVLRHMLDSAAEGGHRANSTERESQMARRAHGYVEGLLKPYTLNGTRPDAPYDTLHEPGDRHAWAKPIFRLCATTHTLYLTKLDLTPSEALLVHSLRGVERQICRVLVGIWASGVENGLGVEVDLHKGHSRCFTKVIERWRSDLKVLMDWLDWSVWVKCVPPCHFDVSSPPPHNKLGGIDIHDSH
jgi:hypothetical protein